MLFSGLGVLTRTDRGALHVSPGPGDCAQSAVGADRQDSSKRPLFPIAAVKLLACGVAGKYLAWQWQSFGQRL